MPKRLLSRDRLTAGPNVLMLTALTAALIVFIAAAGIGARNASGPAASGPLVDEGTDRTSLLPDYEELDDVPGATAAPGATTGPGSTAGPSGAGGDANRGGTGPGATGGSGPLPSQPGATRVGVFRDHIVVGVHAPITFDGQPLNLAEDPIIGLKGYVTWLNRNGGIHGRKLKLLIEDDRYTTRGGQQAADKLLAAKPFLIEGTLGIDQIEKVARAAQQAGTPYMAGGGPEPEFKGLMYQIISNYDQYMDMVVQYVCKYGKGYVGENEVRIGTSTLDSAFILPVRDRFLKKLTERRCVAPVDSAAQQTVIKPTEETQYSQKMLRIRNSYGGKGANLIVPMQDPVTTFREVGELKAYKAQGYSPKWTIANFAHDSDTALALMGGEWTGARILSGGCYYHPDGNPNAYNTNLCAQMKEAHEQWVSLGHVRFDEYSGGCAGGKCEYTYDEGSWKQDGSGGAAGYQLVYFFHKALQDAGPDLTREKFLAALNSYQSYSNLVTGPITFAGSSNHMVGATKFVVLEGQSNLKYRQVIEMTPGLVERI